MNPDPIETAAWNCREWPQWLHDAVASVNEVADRTDMSSEQAIAFAILAAREACAKIAEGYTDQSVSQHLTKQTAFAASVTARSIAAEIRGDA